MAYSAIDIAKYTINKCTVDHCPISNLQLQKILYYIQKSFLENNCLAFDDDFEAWQFGPVVPAVYYLYSGFGASSIRVEYDISIGKEYSTMIDPIIITKRRLNPWDMVQDTHRPGKAWNQIYNGGRGNHFIIPKELIKLKG